MYYRISYILLLFSLLTISVLCSCQRSQSASAEQVDSVASREDQAFALAGQITNSILNEQPDFLNSLFDTLAIRKALSANSIVASQLDTELGVNALNANLHFGDFSVQALNNGGDFRFLKSYFQADTLHLIFRTYEDFGLQIIDYELCQDEHQQWRIVDGYIYNMSATIVRNIMYDMRLTIMQNLNMNDAETAHLHQATQLFLDEHYREVLQVLQQYQTELQHYPVYNFLYINALNEVSDDFIADMYALNFLDEPYQLLHELIYYTHAGNPVEAERVIQQLINLTGEDPIYWLFYGKSLYESGDYAAALDAYLNAEQAMDVIWDLWRGKQDCYYHLKDAAAFAAGYQFAKDNFAMSDEEIATDRKKHYPNI